MATERGWWQLTTTIPTHMLSDADWEHISQLVSEGYTSGEIAKDEDEDEDESEE